MSALGKLARCSVVALVAAAVLTSVSAGGQRWFRCDIDARVRSACCCGSDEAAPVRSGADDPAKLERSCCCEVFTTAALRLPVTEAPASFRDSLAPSALGLPLLAIAVPSEAPDRARADQATIDHLAVPILLRKQSLLI